MILYRGYNRNEFYSLRTEIIPCSLAEVIIWWNIDRQLKKDWHSFFDIFRYCRNQVDGRAFPLCTYNITITRIDLLSYNVYFTFDHTNAQRKKMHTWFFSLLNFYKSKMCIKSYVIIYWKLHESMIRAKTPTSSYRRAFVSCVKWVHCLVIENWTSINVLLTHNGEVCGNYGNLLIEDEKLRATWIQFCTWQIYFVDMKKRYEYIDHVIQYRPLTGQSNTNDVR